MAQWNKGNEDCEGKACITIQVIQEGENENGGTKYGGVIQFGKHVTLSFGYTLIGTDSTNQRGIEDAEVTVLDPHGKELSLDGELGDTFKQIAYESVLGYQAAVNSEEGMMKTMIANVLAASIGAEAAHPVIQTGSCFEMNQPLENLLNNYSGPESRSKNIMNHRRRFYQNPTGGDIQ